MIKIFIIGILICWTVAFLFPVVLKMIKHFKSTKKGGSDDQTQRSA